MSEMKTIDIQCDDCGNWINGMTGRNASFRKVRAMAKENGWHSVVIAGKLLDLCPECWKKHNKSYSLSGAE